MTDFNFDAKRLDLLKKSNELLNKTKNNYKKYTNERKILFEFTIKKPINYDEWKSFLISFEKLINNK